MPVCKYVLSMAMILAFSATHSVSAAYTWSNISPTAGTGVDATTQQLTAKVEWDPSDSPVTSIGVTVIVLGGGTNVTYPTMSTTFSTSDATLDGSVNFSPSLPSGTNVLITFMAITSSNYSTGYSVFATVP